ncbi:MAG TPA: heme-binding protein [Pirellulales bacterium]|jgi:uncharacterized protein GlcG (DUF336 family)|nr:heme-binding protein [Pirellulales bacterium]
MSTKELANISQPGEPAFGIHATNHAPIVIFPDGIPLKDSDEIVGAVGVTRKA